MARIIGSRPGDAKEAWSRSDSPEVLTIALDQNEAVAVRNALRSYRKACNEHTSPTSLNGGGGRVYELLNAIVDSNNWY